MILPVISALRRSHCCRVWPSRDPDWPFTTTVTDYLHFTRTHHCRCHHQQLNSHSENCRHNVTSSIISAPKNDNLKLKQNMCWYCTSSTARDQAQDLGLTARYETFKTCSRSSAVETRDLGLRSRVWSRHAVWNWLEACDQSLMTWFKAQVRFTPPDVTWREKMDETRDVMSPWWYDTIEDTTKQDIGRWSSVAWSDVEPALGLQQSALPYSLRVTSRCHVFSVTLLVCRLYVSSWLMVLNINKLIRGVQGQSPCMIKDRVRGKAPWSW